MGTIIPSAFKDGVYHHQVAEFEAVDDGKPRFKSAYITVDDESDDGDTITVDLFQKFGMRRLMGINGLTHSTSDSIIITEEPTTKVQGTELTITVGGSTDNKKRAFIIYGI